MGQPWNNIKFKKQFHFVHNKAVLNWLFIFTWHLLICLTGARMNVQSEPMESAVLRPASVSTEGSATTWVALASVKQALLVSSARHACVQRGSMASNVTNVAPVTQTTLRGECRLPMEGWVLWSYNPSVQELEGGIDTEVCTLRPFLSLGSPWQKSPSWRKTFSLCDWWPTLELLKLLHG
jgi:hypothetical protein